MGKCDTLKYVLTILLLLNVAFGQTVNDLRPTVTMKEYVDMKNEMLQEMSRLRDEHQKEVNRIKDDNIKIALAAITEKLLGMNEFRGSLEDQNATFITKSELKAWILTMLAIIGAVSSLFWGYSKHIREKKQAEIGNRNTGKNIQSGDTVEVKK